MSGKRIPFLGVEAGQYSRMSVRWLTSIIVLKFTLLSLLVTFSYKISTKAIQEEKSTPGKDGKEKTPKLTGIRTLQDRCEEHDQSLPSYPQPALARVMKEVVRLSSILDDSEAHSRLMDAIQVEDPDLVSAYERQLVSWTSQKAMNWTTEKKRIGLLMPRKPLSEQCIVSALPNPKQDLVTTASSLLHTIAVVYTSPRIIPIIGSDGKNKQFETRQLFEVFATNRLPATRIDKIQTFAESRHVVVWVRSRPYQLDVIDVHGQPVARRTIETILRQILASSSPSWPSKAPQRNIASLSTSLDRDSWARVRDDLIRDNSSSIHTLESAISSIALELQTVDSETERLRITNADTGNVYSDKTMTFSVFTDGGISARVDHSVADGGFFGRLLEVFRVLMASNSQTDILDRVLSWFKWPLPQVATLADNEIDICFDAVDTSKLEFNFPLGYEKQSLFSSLPMDRDLVSYLRKKKLFNLAVQLAFQATLIHILETTYLLVLEPTSVRHFAGGRSDPNFVVTAESISFCEALIHQTSTNTTDPQAGLSLVPAFTKAYDRYLELQDQAKSGSSISAGIAFLRAGVKSLAASKERNAISQSIDKIQNPIYFTGSPAASALQCFEAYIFTDNQLAVAYVGHADRVLISTAGSGRYHALLSRIQKQLEEYIGTVSQVALLVGQDEKI
jgi:Choline/Carnitine o-acyltransferase